MNQFVSHPERGQLDTFNEHRRAFLSSVSVILFISPHLITRVELKAQFSQTKTFFGSCRIG